MSHLLAKYKMALKQGNIPAANRIETKIMQKANEAKSWREYDEIIEALTLSAIGG